MSSGDFWIGMSNPNSYWCNSKQECDGEVTWSDGAAYVAHPWQTLETRSNRGHDCHRVPSATYAADDAESCDSSYTYATLCQFSCDSVDGMWSQWSGWSSCSLSCGGGQQARARQCDDPAPKYGGAQCAGGVSQETQSCNTQDCLSKWYKCVSLKALHIIIKMYFSEYCDEDPPTIGSASRSAFSSPSVEGTQTM